MLLFAVLSSNLAFADDWNLNCPDPRDKYSFGGSAYNVNPPSPKGDYDSPEAVLAATKAASSSIGTYEVVGGQYNLILTYLDRYGNQRTTNASFGVDHQSVCPDGFAWGWISMYGTSRYLCVNKSTGGCDCPSGQKFKETANKCVPIVDAPDEPDPSKDKGLPCPKDAGVAPFPECGNPINPSSGNKVQIESDFNLPTWTNALSLRRTYNSSPNATGNPSKQFLFGRNWSSSFDFALLPGSTPIVQHCFIWQDDFTKACRLESNPSAQNNIYASIVQPDGRLVKFWGTSTPNGLVYSSDPDIKDQLIDYQDANGAHTKFIAAGDQTSYIFDAPYNNLSMIKAANGRSWRVTSSPGDGGTNDSSASRLPSSAPICSHVQSGMPLSARRILCITDDWGRQVNFEYEQLPNDRFTARVTKIIDPTGNEYRYAYDGLTGGCNGDVSSIACNANNLTSVTYPDGGTRLYHYNELSHINNGQPCTGVRTTGKDQGNQPNALTGITDENGVRFADWTYDCSGRATSSQHAGGAERVEIVYTDTDSQGLRNSTIKTYTGSFSNPTVVTNQLSAKLINGQSKNISSDGACPGCGDVAQRTYDANGNTSSTTDRRGNITNFQYDLTRNLETSRTEAFGTPRARTISTSWHPQFPLPLKEAGPLQIVTNTYDASGNLTSRTVQATTDTNGSSGFNAVTTGAPRTWSFTYNGLGQVLTATGPRTDVVDRTTYTYDSFGNVATVTNAIGHVTTYSSYDANGRVGEIRAPNGLVTSFQYSQRGSVTQVRTNDGTNSETTTFEYDSVGQLKRTTLPDGTFISLSYDDAHRLTQMSDSKGNSAEYTLDVQGNRVSEKVKDAGGSLVRNISRVFDSLNQLQQVIGGTN
ncbi:MAG: DUF6531 domain-containing protein [Telluria sp.]